jgi:hypothetical protein
VSLTPAAAALACARLPQVEQVTPTEVVCSAGSDAVLDGLLTVFHLERSNGGRTGTQAISLRRAVRSEATLLLPTGG